LQRARLVLAFDANAVAAARVSSGLGAPRIEACLQEPLPTGALRPSPWEPNFADAGPVREALGRLRQALGDQKRGAVVVLPTGVARTALLEPSAAGPREFARFRLTQGLPYPASEALVDIVAVGKGRFLGAAVRRSIVAEYEEAVASAGFTQERLDLAPLAALDALLRRSPAAAGVDVILGDVGFSLAAHRDGEVWAFRSRLRDEDEEEPARIQAEAERTAAAAGVPSPRIRVVGPGARGLLNALSFRGMTVSPGWEGQGEHLPVEACELAWLGAAQ